MQYFIFCWSLNPVPCTLLRWPACTAIMSRTGTATTGIWTAYNFFTGFECSGWHHFFYFTAVALWAVDWWWLTQNEFFKIFPTAGTMIFIYGHIKHLHLFCKLITSILTFSNHFLKARIRTCFSPPPLQLLKLFMPQDKLSLR